jgi:hypothetical protein
MTILVVGDSLSYGAELPDLPNEHAGLFGNDFWDPVQAVHLTAHPASGLAWPAVLGAQLGQPVENLSLIGGSNSRIYRRTVSAVAQQAYDLVICAWTQLSRVDTAYQGRECTVSAGNPKWPWVKSYFADHFDSLQELERQLAHIVTLQSFLSARNQPYVFVDAIQWCPGRSERDHMVRLIDLGCYAFWGTSLMNMCVSAQVPHGRGGHFLQAGHQLVADQIRCFLQANNYQIGTV